MTTRDPEICSFLKVQWNTLHSIAQLITHAAGTDTAFLVVGDHAPPFALPSRRALWDQTNVPYLLVTPPVPARHPADRLMHQARHQIRSHATPKPTSGEAASADGMF